MTGRPVFGGLVGAALFAAAAAIVVAQDEPRPDASPVRLSLARIDPMANASAWRDDAAPVAAPPATGVASATVLTSAPDQEAANEAEAPTDGEAVITLPGDDTADPPNPIGATTALPQAPLPGLTEASPTGPLPMIAADGRTVAAAYARPFVPDGKPKVALIIGGLGLNAQATREAIQDLPPAVTLSFAPYADGLQGWIDLARAAGHEVLLEAPMEPRDYPSNDPGPYTLLAGTGSADVSRKLDWLMSRASGYFGLTNYLGARFVASPQAMAAFDAVLKSRGLAFVDDGQAAASGGGIRRASADRIIDDQLSAGAIDDQLAALERQASRKGEALGSGFAYPVTLAETAKWARSLADHGYQLAPASALTVLR